MAGPTPVHLQSLLTEAPPPSGALGGGTGIKRRPGAQALKEETTGCPEKAAAGGHNQCLWRRSYRRTSKGYSSFLQKDWIRKLRWKLNWVWKKRFKSRVASKKQTGQFVGVTQAGFKYKSVTIQQEITTNGTFHTLADSYETLRKRYHPPTG